MCRHPEMRIMSMMMKRKSLNHQHLHLVMVAFLSLSHLHQLMFSDQAGLDQGDQEDQVIEGTCWLSGKQNLLRLRKLL